ncbi:hypothetical protein KC19_VG321200 [Ceratodon purpureus]|uniref:Uncharacterized protein n=1 Tax=Ceratodon purpureus TaxID=3225 RepID=A0A8T0HXN7_CERPU|nr:hypothetical protein KC19_VG321200 [Ceratodon purpureus]
MLSLWASTCTPALLLFFPTPRELFSGRCSIMRGVMEQYFIPMGPGKLNGNPIFEIGPASPSGWCLRASRSAPWSHASPSGCCLPSPL